MSAHTLQHPWSNAARFIALALTVSMLLVSPGLLGRARAADPRHVRVGFTRLVSGLDRPDVVTAPLDSTGRLFIVEKPGRIRLRTHAGTLLSTPYLNLTGKVDDSGNEQGMLGLVFHPNFKNNGYFYVAYTMSGGDLRISRFHASPTANRASATEVVFLTVAHPPAENHNGGQLAFGKDGYLYVGTGDGGGAGDPYGNAQRLTTLLGKILRIDVNHGCSGHHYCIPSSNPYATSSTRRREIYQYGVRNPWRFSFDRRNGYLWIGDVGQDNWEEIDRSSPSNGAGRNWGWDCREGKHASGYGDTYCNGASFSGPMWEYSHSYGCAIIGGYVYRGSRYSTLMGGMYIYADYCSGRVWGLVKTSSGSIINSQVRKFNGNITSFGESASGELYATDDGGSVYHLTASSR